MVARDRVEVYLWERPRKEHPKAQRFRSLCSCSLVPGIAKIDNRVKYIAHMLASDGNAICMGKFELGGEGDTLNETAA